MSADKDVITSETEALKRAYAAAKVHDLSLTQEKLATLCGWKSQGSVQKYFSGILELSVESAAKFARALNCKIDDFSPRIADEIFDILSLTKGGSDLIGQAAGNSVNSEQTDAVAIFNGLPDEDVEEFMRLIDERRERYKQQQNPEVAHIVDAIAGLDPASLSLLNSTIEALQKMQQQKDQQKAA